MTLTPPPVPTRFPCWCRAVYSWGGETKRDLGFIEGDLIECINAGDGSWWTGRLYRDRRTVGVFPSNFVQVLPDDFRPTSRSVSPLPASNTPSPKSVPQKARTFRKPFEAYSKAPHYTTAKQPEQYRPSPAPSREPSFNTASQQEPRERLLKRAASPIPPRPMSSYDMRRAASPAPPPSMLSYDMRRAASPGPPTHGQVYSARSVSPIPPLQTYPPRATSPAPPTHSYPPRAVSPVPPAHSYAARPVSPAPPAHSYPARAVSPAPPAHSYAKRGLSPAPSFTPYRPPTQRQETFDMGDSPPPPAPPPHRHVARQDSNASYNPQPPGTPRHGSNASFENRYQPYQSPVRPGSNASFDPRHLDLSRHGSNVSYDPRPRSHTVPHPSQDSRQPYHTPRAVSPCPPSPAGSHMTPSPLREAMDGVIEQLDALGMSGPGRTENPDAPIDPWSPESFDLVSRRSRRKAHERPHTMMGFPHPDEGYETWSGESSQDPSYHSGSRGKDDAPLPDLNNYVDRMEKRFQKLHGQGSSPGPQDTAMGPPPPPPPKNIPYDRPKSSIGMAAKDMDGPGPVIPERKLRHRKSAYDIGREVLGRTFTTKTTSTNSSSGNQSTTTNTTLNSDRSLMSGSSAGAISATSAGSYAMRNRTQSALGMRDLDDDRPETPFTGVTYHSSHASVRPRSQSVVGFHDDAPGLGGLVQPKPPKRSIFKKLLDSAKTGVASGRSHLASGGESKSSPLSKSYAPGFGSNAPAATSSPHLGGGGGGRAVRDTARDMGLGNAVDWVQVRRDVNRSNSLSRIEKIERCERAQMLDYPSINAADELYNSIDGDEGVDGMPVSELIDISSLNLSQVDKNTRFISNLPPVTTATTLATTYVCRPYRSDVQRLRAIFTYVSEKILWEEDYEGEVDTGRVIESKRGCAKEVAVLVYEMCSAIGLSCEIVRGYLKTPGEIPEVSIMPRSNHWWNAVAVDGQWRIMDCSLAAPSNPRRAQYSSVGSSTADAWWFLTRPTEACWTHIPEHHGHQHICPPVAHEILLNLPCTCPPFFRNGLKMVEYNSSLTRIEDLEMVHVSFAVPPDVEVAAEVEVRGFTRDSDGDLFESGETVKKRALTQAEWFGGVKRYTVKALLPGDEGQGVLKVYAGKRGLMHSIKDVPHPLAFALPVIHTGENPAYEFVMRHPTPHAQRHDIYVVQPQCHRLAINNTFVFAIRQHPSLSSSSALTPASNPGNVSPVPFARPGSAMSMTASSSAAGSNPSSSGSAGGASKKPAKLAIQTPGGKILRLMRKDDRKGVGVGGARPLLGDEEVSDGGTWETIIKCSERGTWRGLVLADRTARWCVFAEWLCE